MYSGGTVTIGRKYQPIADKSVTQLLLL